MKLKPLMLAAAVAIALSAPVSAQTISFNPMTGDVWVDQQLGTYNRYGLSDRDDYLDSLVRRFGGDRSWYERALLTGTSPGDLYYACSLASETNRTCSSVLDDRIDTRSNGQGWGALAKRYGIKPGSAEFHRMKARMQDDDFHVNRARASTASPVRTAPVHSHPHDATMHHPSDKAYKGKSEKSGKGNQKNKPPKSEKGHSGH